MDVKAISRIMKAGVPQGTVISPRFYSLYTADESIKDHCFPAKYTAFFAVIHRLSQCHCYLQRQLNAYQRWARRSRLQINAEKSTTVTCSKWQNQAFQPLTYENNNMPYKRQTKHLVVTLDRDLTFSPHIKEIKSRSVRKVSAVYAILRCVTQSHESRLHMFRMILLSTLTYGCPSSHHATSSHLTKLEREKWKLGALSQATIDILGIYEY